MFSASWLIRGYCKKRDFCPFCLPHPFRLKRVSNRKVRVVADGGLSIGKWARVGGNFSCLLHPSFPILGKCAGRDRHCWMDICRSLYGNFPGTKVLSIYFSFIFSSIRQIFMQSSCSLRQWGKQTTIINCHKYANYIMCQTVKRVIERCEVKWVGAPGTEWGKVRVGDRFQYQWGGQRWSCWWLKGLDNFITSLTRYILLSLLLFNHTSHW